MGTNQLVATSAVASVMVVASVYVKSPAFDSIVAIDEPLDEGDVRGVGGLRCLRFRVGARTIARVVTLWPDVRKVRTKGRPVARSRGH